MHHYPADIYTQPEPDKVDIHTDGTWSYEQDTLRIIPGQSEPFHHTDRNRLRKIAEPTPNPTALAEKRGSPL
jgi:hypothetical protein